MDFDFKRRSRVCTRTERELVPGEVYYSALVEREGEIIREDISASAWDDVPSNCIGWWKSRIPERDPNKFFWAPDDIIIDYFDSFLDDEAKQVECYVLALLLVQKKIFRLSDTEVDELGGETMYLICPRRNSEYEISAAAPEPDQIESIQQELIELLFSDEPFETPDVETTEPTDLQESSTPPPVETEHSSEN